MKFSHTMIDLTSNRRKQRDGPSTAQAIKTDAQSIPNFDSTRPTTGSVATAIIPSIFGALLHAIVVDVMVDKLSDVYLCDVCDGFLYVL